MPMKCQQQQRGDDWSMISVHQMADVIRSNRAKMAVVDIRPFLEYHTCHMVDAVNVCCTKLVQRRLQDGKVR
jgi:dual specificity MAP kinase phosphatase